MLCVGFFERAAFETYTLAPQTIDPNRWLGLNRIFFFALSLLGRRSSPTGTLAEIVSRRYTPRFLRFRYGIAWRKKKRLVISALRPSLFLSFFFAIGQQRSVSLVFTCSLSYWTVPKKKFNERKRRVASCVEVSIIGVSESDRFPSAPLGFQIQPVRGKKKPVGPDAWNSISRHAIASFSGRRSGPVRRRRPMTDGVTRPVICMAEKSPKNNRSLFEASPVSSNPSKVKKWSRLVAVCRRKVVSAT